MIGNYILTISKGEAVQQYMYPVGNDKRILDDARLALLSGYVVLIVPPERRKPGVYVIQSRQLFPEEEWQDHRDSAGNVMAFHSEYDAKKSAHELSAEPRNKGYAFKVDQRASVEPEAKAAAERRDYLI